MDFEEVISTRRSVRSFQNREIPEEIINKMMEAAKLSPSFQNRQCWRYIVVRDRKMIYELALKSGLISKVNFFIKDAPIVVAACADPGKSGIMNGQSYYLVDTAISFQQMMLTAWNFGIGSCWLAAFNEKKIKKILDIPTHIRVVGISPFGYPADRESFYGKSLKLFAGSNKRKNIDEIVKWDKWKK